MEQLRLVQCSPNELQSIVNNAVEEKLQSFVTQLPKEPKGKEVLNRKEAAELFSVSTVTIWDWCNKSILHPYKVGNRVFFKRSELMEVMEASNRSK